MSKFERITRVRLPFDMRNKDPNKDYGIHGLDVWFILKGTKGAVQFMVNFPSYLPHVELEKQKWKYTPEIMGVDVGYHAYEPQYEGQEQITCDLLENNKCYYGGSGLQAEEWVKEIFSIRGEHPDKRLWKKLEQEYKDRFGE